MLCQFTFDNFRSYRDETTFDMQASPMRSNNMAVLVPPTFFLVKLSEVIPSASKESV